MFWPLRARIGYRVARWLMRFRSLVSNPRSWRWMQGQYARMAALGDRDAQSFYGHLLLHRGQGLGARDEGIRLLRLAAGAGDSKSAYQLGVLSLDGDARQAPDAAQAARWWELAAERGHPLAARKLVELYRAGGPGLVPDAAAAERAEMRASRLGF